MHAAFAVHQLGDAEIGGVASQQVRVLAAQFEAGGEEVDHFAKSDLDGKVEVFVEAHGHVVGGRFGEGPANGPVLANGEAEHAGKNGFEGGKTHLAVALAGMRVANREQSATRVNRNVQCRAGDEFLVVEISGVNPGRS